MRACATRPGRGFALRLLTATLIAGAACSSRTPERGADGTGTAAQDRHDTAAACAELRGSIARIAPVNRLAIGDARLPEAEGEPLDRAAGPARHVIVHADGTADAPAGGPAGADGGVVYLVADARARASAAAAAMRANPDVRSWRLLVQTASADPWSLLAPHVPAGGPGREWFGRFKARAQGAASLDVVGPLLEEGIIATGGTCKDSLLSAVRSLAATGATEAFALALDRSLAQCQCHGIDGPGLQLVLEALLLPMDQSARVRWRRLQLSAVGRLPAEATVAELARAHD